MYRLSKKRYSVLSLLLAARIYRRESRQDPFSRYIAQTPARILEASQENEFSGILEIEGASDSLLSSVDISFKIFGESWFTM